MLVDCTINNKKYSFNSSPTKRVLDIIREDGITSVKEGCGEGECGACSIFFDGKLVNSCLLVASQMDGSEILTLDGLLEETKEIRESFIKEGAIQCGFCTGGFVLRAYDYIKQNGKKDEDELKKALDGNICRCTGYQKIVEAILKSMR